MGAEAKAKGDVGHLDHFVVAVMDADRAEKFYSEVLGARTLKRFDSPNMNRVFMKLGENHVGLFSQGKATLPKRENAASYPRHSFLIPEGEFEQMQEKIRRESPFVREIRGESGLGCCWNEGLVFQDSEENFLEIARGPGISKTRVHHLHFDTTDLDASVNFYKSLLNFSLLEQRDGMAVVGAPSNQCVILNQVKELSEVSKTAYRGRHFAFNVTDDNFHAIVDKLHRAGIEETRRAWRARGKASGAVGYLLQGAERFSSADYQRGFSDLRAPRKRLRERCHRFHLLASRFGPPRRA